jgi:hypothetical protein
MSVLALAPIGAPQVAGTAVHAGPPAVVVTREDGAVRRPPVPAQPLEAAGDGRAERVERDRRRLAQRLRRIGRVTGDPGHPHHAIVQVEVRLERRVVDRPVVGHAIEASHAKIRRSEAREVRAPVDRAPAHRVVHQRRDRGTLVVDRIVLGETAHVWLGAPVRLSVELPVGSPMRISARVHPVALLQADHADAGAREPPGDRGARGAGADHEDVSAIVSGHGTQPDRLYYDRKRREGFSSPVPTFNAVKLRAVRVAVARPGATRSGPGPDPGWPTESAPPSPRGPGAVPPVAPSPISARAPMPAPRGLSREE